jgi:predicted DCC family thiol-disulfide oxidoreductase YuxK
MTEPQTQTPAQETDTAVLYNASCPVCRFEIDHYAGYAGREALPIRFEDLNRTDLARWGLTRDQAARRLYVRRGDVLLSGIPAFIALWKEMPKYRWLARIVSTPGVHWCACVAYDRVIAPILYHWQRVRYAGAEKSGKRAQTR